MYLQGEQRGECAESHVLALQLIELAIAAGWKPRECIEFAREAYKFVMSTLPGADQQPGVGRLGAVEERPKWGPDIQTKRKTLQTLADRNLMMREAAEILGVSHSVVASTAFKLKIRFHGRRGQRRPPTPTPKATSKLTNSPARLAINDAAVAKLVMPVDRGLRRRCPSCNQVFEPAEVSHYLCDDCEGRGHAGRS